MYMLYLKMSNMDSKICEKSQISPEDPLSADGCVFPNLLLPSAV